MSHAAPAEPYELPAPPWARFPAPSIVATLLAALQLLWFLIEALRGFFWQDDFVFLHLAATVPIGELLFSNYNGHLQPGAFLLSWFAASSGTMAWPAAALPMVLMHAVALWLLWRFLTGVYGPRWMVLVPFVVVAFSPLTFVLSMWWAYGLQLLPLEVALCGALATHLAYLRRPGLATAAPPMLFTVFGLAFAEKAVLVPFVLAGLTVALTGGAPLRRVVHVARTHARLWLGYLVLLVGYAVLHSWRAPLGEGGALPTPGELGTLARLMIGEGLLPAVYGGPWSGDWVGFAGLAPPPAAVLGLTWTLSAVLVAVSLWRGRWRAVAAWLTLAGYLAVSVALLAAARLDFIGTLIGTDPRYIADALPVAAICATVALSRPAWVPAEVPATGSRQVGSGPASPSRPPVPEHVRRLAGVGVPLALAFALVVGAMLSIRGTTPETRHQSTRDYVDTVRAAGQLEPDLTLFDAPIPGEAMLPLFGDAALASRALYGLGLNFDRPTGDLRMLDSAGSPRPIGLVATVPAKDAPKNGCGYAVREQAVRIAFTREVPAKRLVVQFGYYTAYAVDGAVSTPTQDVPVHFRSGLNLLSIVVDGPFDQLLVRADGAVCVTNAVAGFPLPQPD